MAFPTVLFTRLVNTHFWLAKTQVFEEPKPQKKKGKGGEEKEGSLLRCGNERKGRGERKKNVLYCGAMNHRKRMSRALATHALAARVAAVDRAKALELAVAVAAAATA